MSWQHAEGVAFHDVANYFSDEEWKLLHEWQKELYRNVMKEIHQALISLGPLIATTVFSLRTKEKQELVPMDNQGFERGHGIHRSPSEPITHPDVLLSMNREENLCFKDSQDTDWRKQNDGLSTGFPFLKMDVCLKKEEPVSIFIDHLGEEVRESSTDPNPGHPGVSFHIKDEKETSCMDHQGSRRIESTSSSTGVKTSVNSNQQQQASSWERTSVSSESGFDHKLAVINHQRIQQGETVKACTGYGSSVNHSPTPVKQKGPCRGDIPYPWTEYTVNFTEPALHSPHQTMHTELEMFICSQCGNCFKQSANNIAHQKNNNREQQNTCSECEKGLHQYTKQSKDQDEYMGGRPYKCNECGKSFQKSQRLMVHQRVHTGEKPYPCTICGKNFRQLPHLGKHQRMHMGEKPYICNICDKRFIDASHLRRHQQIHTRVTTNMKPTGLQTVNKTVED